MMRFLTKALAIAILIAPAAAAFAQPQPGGSSAHIRTVTFHDRSPRPHVHTIQPHH